MAQSPRPHTKIITTTTRLPPNVYEQDGRFRYRFTVAPALRPFFDGAANVMGTLATLPPDADAAKVEFAPIRRAHKARLADLRRLSPAERLKASFSDSSLANAVRLLEAALPTLPRDTRRAIAALGGATNFASYARLQQIPPRDTWEREAVPDPLTLPDAEALPALRTLRLHARQDAARAKFDATMAPGLAALSMAEVPTTGPTLSFVMEQYLTKSDLSLRTITQNRGLLLRLIQHCGDIAADLVTPAMLHAFLDAVRTLPPNNYIPEGFTFRQAVAWAKDNPDEKRPLLKPTAANNYVAKIKAMFAKAEKLSLITSNPALKLEKSKDKRPKSRKVRRYWEEELSAIVHTASNHPTWHTGTERGLLLMVAIYSGARLQEPLGLRKRDIVEKAGSWFFHFEYNEERNQKTVQSERDTPIHSAILPAVLARVATLKGDNPLVFPSFPPAKAHTLSRQFKTLCPPVGNVSPWHSFRHSFEWHAENVAKLRPVMIATLTGHNTAMYDTTPDHAQTVEAMEKMYVTGFCTRPLDVLSPNQSN